MEELGKYETGRPQTVLAPARFIQMLEQGIGVMANRVARHERKLPKSRTERDREFHSRAISEARAWITDCELVLADLRKWMQETGSTG